MKIKVYFSEEDYQREDFDDFKLAVCIYLSRLDYYLEKVEKHHETQKEKACDKGIRKQRRNKAVKNVSKSS